jgi:hypothetical protein
MFSVAAAKIFAVIFADLDQNDPHPRPAHNSNSAEQMQAVTEKAAPSRRSMKCYASPRFV